MPYTFNIETNIPTLPMQVGSKLKAPSNKERCLTALTTTTALSALITITTFFLTAASVITGGWVVFPLTATALSAISRVGASYGWNKVDPIVKTTN